MHKRYLAYLFLRKFLLIYILFFWLSVSVSTGRCKLVHEKKSISILFTYCFFHIPHKIKFFPFVELHIHAMVFNDTFRCLLLIKICPSYRSFQLSIGPSHTPPPSHMCSQERGGRSELFQGPSLPYHYALSLPLPARVWCVCVYEPY